MPILILLAVYLTLIVGWINNVIWTFHQTESVNLILGILGAIIAPIGMIHGIYQFF